MAVAFGNCWPQLGHAGPTGPVRGFAGVVPLPGLQNRTQGHTGACLVSPSFPGALLLRHPRQLALQVVIHRLLDRPDGKLQGAVPHFTGLGAHLGGFYVDKLLFLQLANVLGNGVGTHASVLANLPDAGPALMRFPVLTEHQVGVDRQLARGKPQREDRIGQKKIVAQRAAVGVSILEFRGVPSPKVFKDSTPMFWRMSIEESNFTLRSQVYSCKRTADPVC